MLVLAHIRKLLTSLNPHIMVSNIYRHNLPTIWALRVPDWSQLVPNRFVCLFWGFKVLRDVIHDHYIRRPKERGRQVGKEGVSRLKLG